VLPGFPVFRARSNQQTDEEYFEYSLSLYSCVYPDGMCIVGNGSECDAVVLPASAWATSGTGYAASRSGGFTADRPSISG